MQLQVTLIVTLQVEADRENVTNEQIIDTVTPQLSWPAIERCISVQAKSWNNLGWVDDDTTAGVTSVTDVKADDWKWVHND